MLEVIVYDSSRKSWEKNFMITAIVLGASGSVGQELVRELLDCTAFTSVVALVRKPLALKHTKLQQEMIPTMTGEALNQSVVRILQSSAGDAVGFSTLGIGAGTSKLSIEEHRAIDVELNTAFARALKSSGRVKHLAFMSAAGADPKAKVTGTGAAGFARYNRVKGEAEEGVKAEGPEIVSIFRPALIIGSQHSSRILEVLIPLFSFMTPSKYLSITTKQIAQAMIAAALHTPQKTAVYHYPEMKSWIERNSAS